MIRTGSSFQNDLLFFGVPLAERLPGAFGPLGAPASVPFPSPAALASAGPGGVLARGPEDDASAGILRAGPVHARASRVPGTRSGPLSVGRLSPPVACSRPGLVAEAVSLVGHCLELSVI